MTFRDFFFLVPFFLISFFALRPTVPGFDSTWISIWAFIGAAGMTAVAWIALQMFKSIVFDERKRKAAEQDE